MSITPEELDLHIRLGEDSHWEFKEVRLQDDRITAPRQRDLADEIAAFANARGGVLVCGVGDKGNITPMERKHLDELERLLFHACMDSIEPEIYADIERVVTREGYAVLAIAIPQGLSVHRSPGGVFRRMGSSKRLMSHAALLRLAQERSQARFLWFDKQVVPQTGLNLLEPPLYQRLLSTHFAQDPENGLMQLGLLGEDQQGLVRATVAGVLFCTSHPERWLPHACIRATRYQGTDQAARQLDHQNITGPLDQQIRLAVMFVMRNMRVSARKQPGRVEIPQFSEKAVFEAIVNAVAHRDYSIKEAAIRLAMFDDRLELYSPGALPNTVTVDSMRVRQATRNEVLASVLGRLRIEHLQGGGDREFFLERRGDGVPIIYRETEALCGAPPVFQVIDEAELCLVLPAAKDQDSAASVTVVAWIRDTDRPLPGADILALFPDHTWQHAITDSQGEARLSLHSTHLPMTVLAAAPGHMAHVEEAWIPAQRNLVLALRPLAAGSSVIFREGTGQIPGLHGRLTPQLDAQERTYLFAANITINEGMNQPVYFQFGQTLRLEDVHGRRRHVRIMRIVGRSSLLEYQRLD